MPLKTGKSDRTRAANIKTEIAAGRPVKQAVAIGYAKQREAQHVHVTKTPTGQGSPTMEEVKAARKKKGTYA